jgi:hypothetical protein
LAALRLAVLVKVGAFQSDVALLGCDIQISPNPQWHYLKK